MSSRPSPPSPRLPDRVRSRGRTRRRGGHGGRAGARRPLRPGGPPRRSARGVRPGRAVRSRSTSTCSSASRPSRCAGPGGRRTSSKIGPSASDLVNRYEYHLDFPGDAARPRLRLRALGATAHGRHVRRPCTPTSPPIRTTPGKLALQYWFFYPFNDFNNPHEGDWEMIQLVFDADDARRRSRQDAPSRSATARTRAPNAPPGATRSSRSSTAPIRSSTRPPARTPTSSLRRSTSVARPRRASAATTPSARTASSGRSSRRSRRDPGRGAQKAFPWIAFEGRWGELQPAFFNGPTGPNLKTQWTHPIEWSQDWRDRGYAVPAGGVFGTGATDLFCTGVADGSKGLVAVAPQPRAPATIAVLGWLSRSSASRSSGRPGCPPLRCGSRDAAAGVRSCSASARMYVARRTPVRRARGPADPDHDRDHAPAVAAVPAASISSASSPGQGAGAFAVLAVAVGVALTLLGLGLVQAATACALVEIDAGRPIGPVRAYRLALRRIRPLLGAIALFVVAWVGAHPDARS